MNRFMVSQLKAKMIYSVLTVARVSVHNRAFTNLWRIICGHVIQQYIVLTPSIVHASHCVHVKNAMSLVNKFPITKIKLWKPITSMLHYSLKVTAGERTETLKRAMWAGVFTAMEKLFTPVNLWERGDKWLNFSKATSICARFDWLP